MKEKSNVFNIELTYIQNKRLKESAIILLNLLPDYFYKVPASSSGKFHPLYASGNGGLIRHIKASVRIAIEILTLECIKDEFTNDEIDLIIISLLLHDGLKHGKNYNIYTLFEHPLIIGEFIKENKDKTSFSLSEIEFLIDGVTAHMGEWNKNSYNNIILPKPKTKYQKFIHICDFLSSRKFLDITFDKNNNIV